MRFLSLPSGLGVARSLVVFLLALMGCTEPEPELPPVVADLPRVEYRSDSDLALCPQAAELVQERIEVLEAALGIEGPPKIRYVHVTDSNRRAKLLRWHGCWGQGGCFSEGAIFTGNWVHRHEIVHAVMSLLGRSNSLLEEGLATAFGNQLFNPYSPGADWRELINLWPGEEGFMDNYRLGAQFVAYLWEKFGAEPLIELYRRIDIGPPETFASVFHEIYGLDLDEVWEVTRALPSWTVCLGVEPNTDFTDHQNSGCFGNGFQMQYAWEVEEVESLAIQMTHGYAWLASCDIEREPLLWWIDNRSNGTHLTLATWQGGKYFAGEYDPSGGNSPEDDSFRVRRGSFLGRTCNEVEPLLLETAPSSLEIHMVPRLSVPPYDSPYEQWAAIEWLGEEPLVYSSSNVSQAWFACSECDDLNFLEDEWIRDHCVQLQNEPVTLPPGVIWILNRGATTDPELRLHGMTLSGLQ